MTLLTRPFPDAIEDVSRGNPKVPQSAFAESGALPIVDQGQKLVAGYTDDESLRCRLDGPLILFGDHTRAFKYVDFPFVIGADGVKVLRVREGWDPKYVYHYLQSREVQSAGYSRHFKFLKQIEVPQPSLDEQRRIAAILDHADALRAKRRQVLAHLDALTQSIFHNMFGSRSWESVTLDEISLIAGEYGAAVPSIDMSQGMPRYVRITDITDSGELNGDVRAPGGLPVQWQRYRLEDGDLLFARSGATVGKTYRHRAGNGECVFAGYLIRFRPNRERVDPDYLFGVTRTSGYRAWVGARQNVVAQPNINAKQYGRELPIPLPPLELQRQFAKRIGYVNDRRAAVQRTLTFDDELFVSLQSRAFRGEL